MRSGPSANATRLVLLAALALSGACATPHPVHLSTEPAGARILVDGVDSGFVTPAVLDLDAKNRVEIDFVLRGYESATRTLVDRNRSTYVLYEDWTVHYNTWRFPLWLNYQDFFVPIKDRDGKQPSRVFVRLERRAIQ